MKKTLLVVLIPFALAGCKKQALKPRAMLGGPPSITYPATNSLTQVRRLALAP